MKKRSLRLFFSVLFFFSIIFVYPADYYWVGGKGNWSDINHWATTSGGSTFHIQILTPFDNVYFDSNSFSSIGDSVNMNVEAYCKDMVWNGVQNTPTLLRSTSTLSIYGSLELDSPMVCSLPTINFESTDTGQTIRTRGNRLSNINFHGKGGGWTLLDSLEASSISLREGNFNTQGYSIDCNRFTCSGSSSMQIKLDTSTVRARDWSIYAQNIIVNSSKSIINCNNDFSNRSCDSNSYNIVTAMNISTSNTSIYIKKAISRGIRHNQQGTTTIEKAICESVSNGGQGVYITDLYSPLGLEIGNSNTTIIGKAVIDEDLIINDGGNVINHCIVKGNGYINGSNRFDTLILTPGKVYVLEKGEMQTITDSFKIQGNNCLPISLKSSSAGLQTTISKPSGNVLGNFISMQDINATGGAVFYAGNYSTNISNNSGWSFTSGPGYIYGLGQDTGICAKGNFLISTDNFNGGVAFLWHDSSTLPYFVATQPDTFWVRVDFGGQCYITDTIILDTTYPSPDVSFSVNDSIQCFQSNNFVFSNRSTYSSGTLSYSWDFGDGTTSILDSVTHNYTYPDTFNVLLIASTDKSCKDTFSMSAVVILPKTDFTINDSTQCINGNNFIFTDNTTGCDTVVSYSWDLDSNGVFNDGSGNSISKSFSNADTFWIGLQVITPSDTSIIYKPIFVGSTPISDFTINDTDQCLAGNNFVFANNSIIPSGTLSYFWKFGDGDTSTSINPNHKYSIADTFNITLITSSQYGCKDSITKKAYLYVRTVPVAGFSINDSSQCLNGNNFIFSNYSTISSGTITYEWKFGDGNSSQSQSPSYNYSVDDTFVVVLTSISDWGCKDSMIKSTIVHPKPIVDFSINDSSQCLNGNIFIFTDSSFINSGSLTSYIWNTGDGSAYSTSIVNHSYSSLGVYNIKLKVVSNLNCEDYTIKTVEVLTSPIADFSLSDSIQCLDNNNFIFTDKSSSSTNLTYLWDFGDGDTSNNQNPIHKYASNDTFIVKLIVTLGQSCKDSISRNAYVAPSATAGFEISNHCVGDTAIIKNSSKSISDSIINFLWDFGDGNQSIVWGDLVHMYDTPGTYVIHLIALTKSNCRDTVFKTISVYSKPIVDIFIDSDTIIYPGKNVVLTVNGVYDSILWSTED